MAPERPDLLRQRGVETVILAGADAYGVMRGERVPAGAAVRATAMRRAEPAAVAGRTTARRPGAP